MAISMTAAINAIADLVRTVDGVEACYSAGEIGAEGMPQALVGPFPCALVYPGADTLYVLTAPHHRHSYEVIVQVYAAGPDMGVAAYSALPIVDAVIEKMLQNVTLNGVVNSCVYQRQSGLSRLEYAGADYTGYELVFDVSEEAAITVAAGS